MAKKRAVVDPEDEEGSPRKKSRNDDNDQHEDEHVDEHVDDDHNHHSKDNGGPIRSINPAGKPAEAGIIHKVYVENFMCHRKLTISLCRNVNFIHGKWNFCMTLLFPFFDTFLVYFKYLTSLFIRK